VFANGGYQVSPQLITRITDAKGQVLKSVPVTKVDESARVIDARNAFITDSMLREVTRSGTVHQPVPDSGVPIWRVKPVPPAMRLTAGLLVTQRMWSRLHGWVMTIRNRLGDENSVDAGFAYLD
jgi:hypothetical protein